MDKSTPNNSKRQLNEVRDFHPIVAKWLQEMGYSYDHHVRTSDGVADFVATIDGKPVVIECKVEPVKGRDCAQAVGYCIDIPNASAAIAVPTWCVDNRGIRVCEKWGVDLIPFQVTSDDLEDQGRCNADTVLMELTKATYNRSAFLSEVIHQPQTTIESIITYHALRKSSPVFDTLMLIMLLQGSNPLYWSDVDVTKAMDIYLFFLTAWSRYGENAETAKAAITIFRDTKRSYVMARDSGGEVNIFPNE